MHPTPKNDSPSNRTLQRATEKQSPRKGRPSHSSDITKKPKQTNIFTSQQSLITQNSTKIFHNFQNENPQWKRRQATKARFPARSQISSSCRSCNLPKPVQLFDCRDCKAVWNQHPLGVQTLYQGRKTFEHRDREKKKIV